MKKVMIVQAMIAILLLSLSCKKFTEPPITKLAPPTLYPPSGTYGNGSSSGTFYLYVEAITELSFATIYYTTDGSQPNHNSDRYTNNIRITLGFSTPVLVRAIASAEGYEDSEVVTASYIRGNNKK